jgi:spoIIIJ-associated protein
VAEDGVDFSGRTVEEATTQAETYFGGSRADLRIEVVTQGRGGVFGIGAEPARIRVQPPRETSATEPVVQDAVAPAPQQEMTQEYPRQVEAEAPTEHVEEFAETVKEPRQETATATADLPGDALEVLDQILKSMGFDAVVSIRSTESPVILSVSGQNLGVLIGRRGDNLASLQFMVNLILSKGRRQWPRIVIDVENYRARREESLRSLADRIAYRVERSGRPFTLEAMPASDRRVIHLALRERGDIETYSIGEGVSRRVVIAPIRSDADADEDRDE